MLASELIASLQDIVDSVGDLPVVDAYDREVSAEVVDDLIVLD